MPCSGQCSFRLSWGLAFRQTHPQLGCAFDSARHHGNSSGYQMPTTTAPAGGFLSILGFEILKLTMTAQQLGAVNQALLAATCSKVRV